MGAARGLGPGVDQLELRIEPTAAARLAALRDGSVQVAELGQRQLESIARDPLLVPLADTAGGIGAERSVRGLLADPVPALYGVWLTTLGSG